MGSALIDRMRTVPCIVQSLVDGSTAMAAPAKLAGARIRARGGPTARSTGQHARRAKRGSGCQRLRRYAAGAPHRPPPDARPTARPARPTARPARPTAHLRAARCFVQHRLRILEHCLGTWDVLQEFEHLNRVAEPIPSGTGPRTGLSCHDAELAGRAQGELA
jgi:hypothetical protein